MSAPIAGWGMRGCGILNFELSSPLFKVPDLQLEKFGSHQNLPLTSFRGTEMDSKCEPLYWGSVFGLEERGNGNQVDSFPTEPELEIRSGSTGIFI